jgi:multicomponent Na+:H+ antiporter subunit E
MYVKSKFRLLNPLRWLYFAAYIIHPFSVELAKANIDVAKRVITGKIRPGIVKINPELHSGAAITLLANSITLTPGTLTVDIDEKTNELYVHWIYVTKKDPKAEDICSTMPVWARRIAD